MKKLLLVLILCASPAFGSAANIYLSQSGGTLTCNGVSQTTSAYTFFNSGANWGAGGTQIGAGTTVWLVGTITGSSGSAILTFQGSGTSGNPVTLKWCTGAILQAPYMGGTLYSGTGGITANSKTYLVIDGGTNGILQNTANGTAGTYANQQGSQGIAIQGCTHVTVQNLTVQNIYVKTNITDTAWNSGGNNGAIVFDASDYDVIQNNVVTQASVGISLGYEGTSGITSALISGNTASYGCHVITIGDGTSNSTASGITVSGNTVVTTDIWNDPSSTCHEDGIGPISAYNSGSSISTLTINNNTINGNMCTSYSTSGATCTAPIFLTGSFSGVNVFNNIFAMANTSNYESLLRFGAGRTDNTGTIATVGVYNNTMDCGWVGSTGVSVGIKVSATGSAPTGYTYKNNIIVNCGWGLNAADATSGSWGWLTSNNNDYFNNAYVAQSASLGTYSFSGWQTAGFDANGSAGNPLFGTNYTLSSGSAAISLGANLTSLSITALDADIINVARPSSGAWDAGAKQFASTPPPTFCNGCTAISQLLPPTNLIARVGQ